MTTKPKKNFRTKKSFRSYLWQDSPNTVRWERLERLGDDQDERDALLPLNSFFFRYCRKTNLESTSDQLVLRWDISHFPLQVISGKKSIFFVSESESFSKIFVTESIFVRKFRFPSCWVIPSGDLTGKRHLRKRKRKKLCCQLHRNYCFIWTKVKFGLMVRCVALFLNDFC